MNRNSVVSASRVAPVLLVGLLFLAAGAHAESLALRLVGPGTPTDVPFTAGLPQDVVDELDEALCYSAPVVDMETDLEVGLGYDCFSSIVVNEETGVITLVDTIFFRFPSGWIVGVGEVTIAPNLTGDVVNFTHITGSHSAIDNIVHGRGRFHGASGKVRVSGGVNMAAFPDAMDFDCLWRIDLNSM